MSIGTDKLKHFGVCLLATAASFGVMRIFFDFNPSIVACNFLPIGLAVGKEYGDSKASGNKWDWLDILADVLGILVFIIPAFIIHRG